MKSRLSSLDIYFISHELAASLSNTCRLQNIYDYNNQKAFVFKFSRADFKLYLLVESGFRLHETEAYQQEDARAVPTGFVAKLRKHLRNRRLTCIKQVGFDRVVELEFQAVDEEGTFYLYLEFYSLGNVILCDHERRVVALLRTVNTDTVSMRVGDIYSTDNAMSLKVPTIEDVKLLLNSTNSNKALKQLLSALPSYVIQYILETSGNDKDIIATNAVNLLNWLSNSTQTHSTVLVKNGEQITDFYCLSSSSEHKVDSVNKAADLFFSQRESVEVENKEAKIKKEAETKLKAIEDEQLGRISSIENSIEQLLLDAQTIESNISLVEAACLVVRTCVENKMTWPEVEELLTEEKRKKRPTAMMIEKLKLAEDKISLRLSGLEGERIVDVNIFMSAHGNASSVYEQRNQLVQKLARTKQAYDEAIRSANEKINRALKEHSAAANRVKLQKSRKTFWFERFAWFISSDNYLILGGKDAQQNEILVKRYLRQTDIYVHAEISGAASVVIRNHLDYPIPQRTLTEAGNLAVCMSRAWEAKIVVGAWWVKADQVSKTAPSGEYLGTGSFMIRGQKNFLPPAVLQLGFGFLQYSEDEELVAKRREKRLQREEIRRQAFIDGVVPEDDEVAITNMKRYEEAIDLTRISDLSIVESDGKLIKQRPKKDTKPPNIEKTDQGKEKKKNTQNPRGKKGKLKKMKEKYGDQDEEERAERMKLLGSAGKPKTVEPEKEPKYPRESTSLKKTESPLIEEPIDDTPEVIVNEEVSFLDSLTPDQVSEEAGQVQMVPIVGPWSVIRNCSYRVKLQPGPLKKGKLVQKGISAISSSIPDPVKQAIRLIPDTDMVQCLFTKSGSLSLTVSESQAVKHKNKKKNN